ncbi:MAG: nuclear transport factor 2 family protein [Pyrinomonadaceae bacterium]|nr:nuclear transport factor 2 family protein [Pyrinomonadaceae bacterium]
MTRNIAEKFMGALTELESGRDVEMITALFADDCEIGNAAEQERFRGTEGARKFWTNYRNVFKDVCSIIQNETYSDNNAVLELTTEGKIKNGRKIKYDGISVMETESEKIVRFYAFFDAENP